jgi:hypothetical protein
MENEYEHKENYIDGKIQLRFGKGNVPLTGTPDEVRTYFETIEGSKDLDQDFLRYALRRQGSWRNN